MFNFQDLIQHISEVHSNLQAHAHHSINVSLTVRNWLIGSYIVEFEQNGSDRAAYGKKLLLSLAEMLQIKGLSGPELSRCRQFYNCYPQILGALPQELTSQKILGTLSQKLPQMVEKEKSKLISPDLLVNKLSFSHFVELIKISDPLKRAFYEVECIKGTWNVRELKRQINSLYFERSGLSSNPEKLSQMIQNAVTPENSSDILKNVYAFDFLDFNGKDVVEESDLETALIDHLHEFILEMGNGFCFEARQKRILIGNDYYFIDLVFYHRVLKCHVLIELKIGEFTHGDVGQINTYLNYFNEEICEPSDNPPVGILMVAEKDQALVKYATAGMDENLFIQQYLVQLPSVEQLENYMMKEINNLS